MKYILLISILLTTFLSAKNQIVIGTFSKKQSAYNIKNELNETINKDLDFKTFLEENNIKSVVKKDGKYFIVTLEPFTDKKIQTSALNTIKQTKFEDAYILKISPEVQTTTVEPKKIKQQDIIKKDQSVIVEEVTPALIKALDVEKKSLTQKENKKIEVEEKQQKKLYKPVSQPQVAQENFVQTYLIEIIAFIAILILLVIYIFIIRYRHKKEFIDKELYKEFQEQETLEDIVIEDDFDDLKEEQNIIQGEPVYELPEDSQIIEEVPQPHYPTSSVKKQEVPKHNKISKESFKEFEGIRIIIAEDNLINQKVVKGLLAESGIELKVVDDGQEVLNHLEEDDAYSIILMDVHMPNMDGFEATKIIRSNPKYSHITVIALSGDIAADDIAKMREVGMQENLEKPLKMDSLYDILYAYSHKNEKQVEDNLSEKELDAETGLEVCGGDESFYKEILNDFLKNYENSTQKIQESLNNKDLESVHRLLIDVSGVIANIGAKNTQELLKELMQSLQNPEDEQYQKIFEEYSKHFEVLQQEIRDYIS